MSSSSSPTPEPLNELIRSWGSPIPAVALPSQVPAPPQLLDSAVAAEELTAAGSRAKSVPSLSLPVRGTPDADATAPVDAPPEPVTPPLPEHFTLSPAEQQALVPAASGSPSLPTASPTEPSSNVPTVPISVPAAEPIPAFEPATPPQVGQEVTTEPYAVPTPAPGPGEAPAESPSEITVPRRHRSRRHCSRRTAVPDIAVPTITLPDVAAAPSAVAAKSPAQIAAIQAAQAGVPSAAKARQIPQRSIAGRIVRTGFIAVLVAGIGVGARFGYDYYEHGRTAAAVESEAAATDTGFLPAIGAGLPALEAPPVSGRYIDVTIHQDFLDATDSDTTRWQYSLSSPNLVLDYSRAVEGYSLDVRDDRILLRAQGQDRWFDVSDDPDFQAIPDSLGFFHGYLPMFHDVVPVEAIPYVTVLTEVDEQLDIVPIDPPSDPEIDAPDDEIVPDIAVGGNSDPLLDEVVDITTAETNTSTARPSGPVDVRHYTLSIDEAAFATAEPFAHAAWRAEGYSGDQNADLWVDDLGVVRQIRETGDDRNTTLTFNDVADSFPDFQNKTLIASPIVEFSE